MPKHGNSGRVLLLADSDSRIAWVNRLGKQLSEELYGDEFRIIDYRGSRSHASRALFVDRSIDLNALDLILVGFGGGDILKFSNDFSSFFTKNKFKKRPLLLNGFNGICDAMDPHPLFVRSGSDIIFANCAHDVNLFNFWLESTGALHRGKVKLLGYVSHSTNSFKTKKAVEKPSLLFVAQPGVPTSLRERLYILSSLNRLAIENPNWTILVKPRASISDVNITHRENFYYQELWSIFIKKPALNLKFTYESIDALLDQTTICLTLGSTIAIDALGRGITTGVISDFGIRRDYGNHHFIKSNCLISLSEINLEEFSSKVDPNWYAEHVSFSRENIRAIAIDIRELLLKQHTENKQLSLPKAVYSQATAPYIASPSSRPSWDWISLRYFYFRKKVIDCVRELKLLWFKNKKK